MAKRRRTASWAQAFQRSFAALARGGLLVGARAPGRAAGTPKAGSRRASPGSRSASPGSRRASPGDGQGIPGIALGSAGARRYRLYRPPGLKFGERLPLLLMLHGCDQDAKRFAASTRMNGVAARERFFVLYVEQDRLSNPQGCWNWFGTNSRRAYGEAALIVNALDQACLLYPVDRARVAIAGLSAGASMAALLATRYPERFKALAMHSGIPPGTAHSTLSALGAMHGRRATQPLPAAPPTNPWPPLLVIHGSNDAVVSPRNGRAAAEAWAAAAGARPAAVRVVQRGARYPMTVTDFKRRGTIAATLVEVAGLGHAWSGGATGQAFSDPRGPDGSRLVWAFAARQFREQARAAAESQVITLA